MGISAATCSTCGAVLSGYEWSKELNFLVHFCPHCRAKEKTGSARVKSKPVYTRVLDKAA